MELCVVCEESAAVAMLSVATLDGTLVEREAFCTSCLQEEHGYLVKTN